MSRFSSHAGRRSERTVGQHLIVAAALVLTAGAVVGCSAGKPDQRPEVLRHLTNDVIVPGYTTLQSSLLDLRSGEAALCQAPSAQSLKSAQDAWVSARQHWNEVRVFSFGPSMSVGLASAMDQWPHDSAAVIELAAQGTAKELNDAEPQAAGLPGVEQILWSPQLLTTLNGPVSGKAHTCSYLTVQTDRMTDVVGEVLRDWKKPYGKGFISGAGGSVTALLQSAAQLAQNLADDGIARPAGIGEAYQRNANLSREGGAQRGVLDVAESLRGIQSAVDGVGVRSLVATRSKVVVTRYDTVMSTALAATTFATSTRTAVMQYPAQTLQLFGAIKQVQSGFQTDFAQMLGLTLTVNDVDGD